MVNHQPPQEVPRGEMRSETPEIRELEERVEKLEAQLKKEKAPEKKEEIIKQEIKTYLRKLQQVPPSAPPIAVRDEAEEISRFPLSQQIGSLVSLVLEKGLNEAISVARALDNPAVLDEFHDTLVDRYYEELIKRKLLKIK